MNSQTASEAFYAALLEDDPERLYERAPCGYLSTTPDGIIVKANATFLDLTGYDREELVGRRTFAELLTAGGRIYHETHYAPLLHMQGTVREVTFDLVRADGERLPVLVNAAVESDSDGAPRVVRVAVFDATQRRAYEHELLVAKQRAEQSEARAQALARTLQSTLIPPSPPELPGLEVSAAYRPAGDGEEVGGDFYDIFQVGQDDWVVALGDVCGKGVDAAVVTALVRYTIRALSMQREQPSEVLVALNDVLLAQGTDRFCTVALARLRSAGGTWSATLSSGGHPLALHRGQGGAVLPVGQAGSLVGVLEVVDTHDHVVELAPGDVLVLYTDGVTEGRRGREFFGDERLRRSVQQHADSPLPAESILADVLDFQEGSARDDIAVVAVRMPVVPPASAVHQQVREESPS
ncbi:MAG TPA: SpoIIE family protein phosphatase [Nocardioidaceae bacterium]|nr:SpoIIE family protein phosphatase [Nocardioidaceae bacterium]